MPGEEVLSDQVPFCRCPLYSAHFVKMREESLEMGERNCCLPCRNSEQAVLEKSYKTASAHQFVSLLVQVLPRLKNCTGLTGEFAGES